MEGAPGVAVRWLVVGVSSALTLLLVWDLSRPPASQWSAGILLWAIDIYQGSASPALEVAGIRCRFEPSCSHFAEQVILRQGAGIGSLRTIGRILRCGPWTAVGTYDPP